MGERIPRVVLRQGQGGLWRSGPLQDLWGDGRGDLSDYLDVQPYADTFRAQNAAARVRRKNRGIKKRRIPSPNTCLKNGVLDINLLYHGETPFIQLSTSRQNVVLGISVRETRSKFEEVLGVFPHHTLARRSVKGYRNEDAFWLPDRDAWLCRIKECR